MKERTSACRRRGRLCQLAGACFGLFVPARPKCDAAGKRRSAVIATRQGIYFVPPAGL